MNKFLIYCNQEIFLFNRATKSIVLPVNKSAQAIITSINPSENANQAITFISQKGTTPANHEILVIEKKPHKAIYIHPNIPEKNVFEKTQFAFLYQISDVFSVISAGVNMCINNNYKK